MTKPKQQPVRYVVNVEAVRNLDEGALPSEDQVSGEGYTPVLQTPNFFRKLYGYTVYHKDAKSAF
jgi:hypothetical protein